MRQRLRRLPLLTVVVFGIASSASGQTFNLGHALPSTAFPVPIGNRWVTPVTEQGSQDWNGDGDQLDNVALLVDDATLAVVHVGPAIAALSTFTSASAFYGYVSEAAQGNADLNGDGDALDNVPFRYDAVAASYAVLPTFSDWLAVANDDSFAYFAIRETAGNELNGDGDTIDGVMFRWDPSSSTPQNLQVAATKAFALANGDLVIDASESSNSIDWNLDGDFSDSAILARAGSASTWSYTGMVGTVVEASGGVAAVVESESSGSVDVNGDGDMSDQILSAWRSSTQTRFTSGFHRQDDNSIRVANGRVVFRAEEAKSGATDLNGDGDAVDRVIAILDANTGVTSTIATGQQFSGTIHYAVHENRLAYVSSEPWLASLGAPADLNGDGDTADFVMTVRDLLSGTVDLGRAQSGSFVVVGDYVGYMAREAFEGATDLNGDGDSNDIVFVVDRFLGDSRSSFLGVGDVFAAPGGLGLAGRMLVFFTEPAVAFDLNGDGDLGDIVPLDFDLAAGTFRNTRLGAIYDLGTPNRLALRVEEFYEQSDLNGDGDPLDGVFHLTKDSGAASGIVSNYGSGCPTSAGKSAKIDLYGELAANGRFALQVTGAAPNSTALVVLGVTPASIGTGLGCPLLTAPVLPVLIGPLPMTANGLLGHVSTLIGVMPNTLPASASACLQAFFIDPVLSFVPSDAVQFTTGP